MAETGGTGGLSTAALGGIGATVVVIGGAVMVWLGVFDGQDDPVATRSAEQSQAEIAISPSASQPAVTSGVSPQQDATEGQETAEAPASPATEQTEEVTQEDSTSDPSAETIAQEEAGEAETAALAPEANSETAGVDTQPEAAETASSDPSADSPEVSTNGVEGAGTDNEATPPAIASDEGEGQAAPQTAVAETAESQGNGAEDAQVLLEAPKLDLVRVDATGETVIAGRAIEGMRVAILLDGEVLDLVDVQAGGEFVAFASIPPSAQARVISLRGEADGQQILSESSFILAPAAPVPAVVAETETEADAPQVAALEEETAETDAPGGGTAETDNGSGAATEPVTERDAVETAAADTGEQEAGAAQTEAPIATTKLSEEPQGAGTPAAAGNAPEVVAATDQATDLTQPQSTDAGAQEDVAEVEAAPAPQPQTAQVAVLRADAEGVTLVQPIAQAPQDKVVLDTISYSDTGEVQLAGRARAEARVLVYLDNAPAGEFSAAANGSWGGRLSEVEPGVYALRLDEVNAEGKVLSRLETPFKREAPEVLQAPVGEAAPAETAPLVRAVTVQEGDTLWAISQERYGSGFLYVRVFEANQEAIRDPDLIYPGQVFTIPE